MSPARFRRRVALFALGPGLLAAAACERSAPATQGDSIVLEPRGAAAVQRVSAERAAWDASAGPMLLVQGEDRDEAIVLFPSEGEASDETRLQGLGRQGAPVSLFGRGGARLSGILADTALEGDAECRIWPLRGVQADGGASTWAVGFVGEAKLAPIALDSVDALTPRDSTALVAEASRLASAVTALTAPSFQGLRFTVHDIRRFEASPGVQALVAHLIRKVNQEANPQEEQTLLIAERDSGVTTGPYQLAFAERTHGLEEQSTTPEVIGAVLIAGRPTLIIARDSDAGVAYAMLERTGVRQWRLRWTSALTRCG